MNGMEREQLLKNLLGTDLQITPDVASMFTTASPATYGPIQGRFFGPYQQRLDMGESQPVGSLADRRSLTNYIAEVQKALAMGRQ